MAFYGIIIITIIIIIIIIIINNNLMMYSAGQGNYFLLWSASFLHCILLMSFQIFLFINFHRISLEQCEDSIISALQQCLCELHKF